MEEKFMKEALKEAQKAFEIGEIPVGAVIVKKGEIIARGHNLKEKGKDPTLHAEIIAIKEASKVIGDWRLNECELYVTLEPCLMCAGAIIQARISKVFFGARDPKSGVVVSLYRIFDDTRWNHRVEYSGGIMERECSLILKEFFRMLREERDV